MTGYRQHGYEPNTGFEEPRPLKPYDKWQWFGVGSLAVAALLLVVSLFVDDAHEWPSLVGSSTGAFLMLSFGGLLLMRYRREPTDDDPQPETSERRRRLGGLAFIAIGVAAVAYNILEFSGA